jgi:hypothetical protein
MGVLSNMVEERYRTTYCVACGRETRQRYLVMNRRWLWFWGVVTCGIFWLFNWINEIGANKNTTCLRCGTFNYPPGTWWRRHYRWHQRGGAVRPVERRDAAYGDDAQENRSSV